MVVALSCPGPAGYTTWIDQVPGDKQVHSAQFRNLTFGHTRELFAGPHDRRPVRYSHMTGKEAVPHEGTKEEVIDEHPVPSRNIGRMRGATVAVRGLAGNSERRTRAGNTLGHRGITRYGTAVPAIATRRFRDQGGPVSGHDPFALRLTTGLITNTADQS